ncbi:hypothetical protein [Streptomyces sp. SCL15-4]|uniref:hypothetical protein n=1 Tax=Streptomyces sp. SCL15-4 TaxID=2967221 RepID=UPI00398F8EF2
MTSGSTSWCRARTRTNAPATPGCPPYSVTCLYRALNGDLDDDEDIVCTVHGPNTDEDQEDDPEGGADLEVQYADAVRE